MRANVKLVESTFKPLGTLVVLQMVKVTETPGGIRLPDRTVEENRTQTPYGFVIATGPECKCGLKRGDEILIPARVSCEVVKHQGVEVVVVTEDKIIGIVPEEERKLAWCELPSDKEG